MRLSDTGFNIEGVIAQAALGYAERGKCIFPCKPRSKFPLTEHGFKDASSDVDRVRTWWQRAPSANIGLATGRRSGMFVLDVDGDEGEASLRALEREHGELPATVEAITGSGGRHLFFHM